LAGLDKGTLTAAQAAALASMAEEEKLAHDVYVRLVAVGGARFERISASESRHLDDVRALLVRYGLTDPTAGRAAGDFASQAFSDLYKTLVTRGSASAEAASAVGREIEESDIADLAKAADGVTAEDVLGIYQRLTDGSRRHLAAFSR
jgi:hypothetical protein